MRYTQYKSIFDRYKQSSKGLHFGAGVADNTATTKLKAVKPDRHTLAIFVPKICEPTKPTFATGTERHFLDVLTFQHILDVSIFGYIPSYDGSSEPNKIPLVGNKFRRLSAVVTELSPLLCGGKLLTKLKGGHTHA